MEVAGIAIKCIEVPVTVLHDFCIWSGEGTQEHLVNFYSSLGRNGSPMYLFERPLIEVIGISLDWFEVLVLYDFCILSGKSIREKQVIFLSGLENRSIWEPDTWD